VAFRIGTSGWQYDHWRGVFYPRGLPKREWLTFYSRHFTTVEINNSFYHLPGEKSWDAWREAAPPGFSYAVKASRFITHFKRFQSPEESLKLLFEGAARLGAHLGPVLYQARPDFARTSANVARLDEFMARLPRGPRQVIEFRHSSWFGQDTLAQLRRHDVAFCCFDMPGFECPLAVTAGFAYLRFHGPGARYDSNYSEDELSSWAERLRGLLADVEEVWAYFNNDGHGYAVRNAQRLRELLA
jgi:uncharacterized protein YecE (DUF72 family)